MRNVFFRARSRFTGAPIVVAFSGFRDASENEKTGRMVQSWILPWDSWAISRDSCGACPCRGAGACYVGVRPTSAVILAIRRGSYDEIDPRDGGAVARFDGVDLRLGAGGEPTAINRSLWEPILSRVHSWTGYTHAWRRKDVQSFRDILQASCDTETDARDAHHLGWATFRVRPTLDAPVMQGEIPCPASAEMGHRTTCARCRMCRGRSVGRDITIVAHGLAHVVRNWRAMHDALVQNQRIQ